MNGRIRQWQAATTGVLLLLGGCGAAPGVVTQAVPAGLPGAGTYAWAPVESRRASAGPAASALPRSVLEKSIDQAMAERGYLRRPELLAELHLDYDLRLEDRTENLAPRDKFLEPRMTCGLHDCRITQQWAHFGPPLRSQPERRLREATVGISIRAARSGKLVWQGHATQELEGGQIDAPALQAQLGNLIRQLPRATASPQGGEQ